MNIKRSFLLISTIILFITIFYYNKISNDSIHIFNKSIINSGNKIEVFKTNTTINNSIGKIIIPKINLEKELYSKESYQNNVNYNIEINKASDMPNVIGGNVILEAHSGDNYNSFFRNLYKIKEGDEVDIIFNNYIYRYLIDNIYYISKNGKAKIKRDFSKSTITLITCTKNDNNKQTIYIGYLKKKECLN